MRTKPSVLALAGSLFIGCSTASEAPDPESATASTEVMLEESQPFGEVITAERGGFIPEGVEYDMTHNRILTGSLTEGSIFQLHPDGSLTTIVTDPDLISSVGIEVDELRNRLLVANADRSVFEGNTAGQAMLGVYDLQNGTRIAMVDLAATIDPLPVEAAFFANDVAVDDNGTAYVTDTRMNVIYRVGNNYEASVLHQFHDGQGPNGIVVHPSGYLLVARGDELWKVPIAEPAAATPVVLPEEIPGQDGMVWSVGRLAIVSNSGNRVVALTSTDAWATADLDSVATYETQATTAAVVDDDVYVVHPHFGDGLPPSVTRVEFQ
ncbi:MAG: hypothetical protein CL484_09275 [Acidobacteria bacterium]|nr:hypothetical protein [Acidobacteriota bacterium]